ncbi:hypothetical protein [Pseudomonas sp. PH1b]|uniref:hypothetical protein n=1 Tax=Pseudomonas sp. PH1b TaxID=1397282 RepID=UPI0004693E0D|nr:hypothetical protein [Pseudomonas sp. PH1b]
MSKLGCSCGHVIVDQTDDLAYKASLMRDGHEEALYEGIGHLSQAFQVAAEAGSLDQLLDRTYGKTAWRPKARDYLGDRLCNLYAASSTCVYECQNCGRLWVQRGAEHRFVSFAPDSGTYEAVLAVEPSRSPVMGE